MLSFFLVITSLLISIIIFLEWNRRSRRYLPPGTTGFPLIGETLRLITAYKSSNPEPFIEDRVRRFGPLFTSHIFGELTVFSTDAEANRFILQNEGKLFHSSYPGSISNLLGKHSLLLMKGGSLHKKMHSFTMSFANSSAMKDHLLSDIDNIVQKNMDNWPSSILLMDEAKKITFELSIKQLLSTDPSEWTERLRKDYVFLIEGFFALPFPFFSTTYHRALKARLNVVNELTRVVRERRSASVRDGKLNNDILGELLARNYLHADEEIVDFLLSLLIGGFETTSTIITLAVKFLTDCPKALAQLKEEQDGIKERLGKGKQVEWIDYKSMAFTQCVVNETLRMANIIGGVFRRASTDVIINGYTIPKGCKVFASFRAVHMNPDCFEDAHSFNPWRWEGLNNEARMPSIQNAFMPFGGGVRLCPGYELARVALSIFLYNLTTRFRWCPSEDDKLVFFPTTRTEKRYPINLIRRGHKDELTDE